MSSRLTNKGGCEDKIKSRLGMVNMKISKLLLKYGKTVMYQKFYTVVYRSES